MLPFPLGNIVMICIGLIFIYLAVAKKYEPLLLLPIGFGAILVNIPYSDLMEPGGFLRILYDAGIMTDIFPLLIFIGIGAMTDFGILLEKPWLLVFAGAGQIGIFAALMLSLLIGFPPEQAASIGIIGAMDGPTAIYVTSRYAPEILGPVSVCAYSYMSLIPILQIPIIKALTSRKERLIRMDFEVKSYPKPLRVLFPIIICLITSFVAPGGTALMGSLMFGNLLRESGVVERLRKGAENELTNITTLLLGVTIGGTMEADRFLNLNTLFIFALGLISFIVALGAGVIFGKMAYLFTKRKVNPIIGSCGVSAFPMAARTAHMVGRQEDPDNWLLPVTMAVNTGGQIGSVVAGGLVLTYIPILLGL